MFEMDRHCVRHIVRRFVPIVAAVSICAPTPALADMPMPESGSSWNGYSWSGHKTSNTEHQEHERNLAALAILIIAGVGAGIAIYEIQRKVNDVDAQIAAAGKPSSETPIHRGQLQQETVLPAQDIFGSPDAMPSAQPYEDSPFTAADARKVASAATTRKKTEAVENLRWRIARLRQEVLGGIRDAADSGAEGLQVDDSIVRNDLWPAVAATLQNDGYRIDVDTDEDGNRIGAAIIWGIDDEEPDAEQPEAQAQTQDISEKETSSDASPAAGDATVETVNETVDAAAVQEEAHPATVDQVLSEVTSASPQDKPKTDETTESESKTDSTAEGAIANDNTAIETVDDSETTSAEE